jgi:hypothetical protein
MGVELDLSDKPVGLGVLSRRYALLADDGVVKVLNLEEGGFFASLSPPLDCVFSLGLTLSAFLTASSSSAFSKSCRPLNSSALIFLTAAVVASKDFFSSRTFSYSSRVNLFSSSK